MLVRLIFKINQMSITLHFNVTGSNFEITFVLEKHLVEDDV